MALERMPIIIGPGPAGGGGGGGGGATGGGGGGGGSCNPPPPVPPNPPVPPDDNDTTCDSMCVPGQAGGYPQPGSSCGTGGSVNPGPIVYTELNLNGNSLSWGYNDETGNREYITYEIPDGFTIPKNAVGIEIELASAPYNSNPNPISFDYAQFATNGGTTSQKHELPEQPIYHSQVNYPHYGGPTDRLGFSDDELGGHWNSLVMWFTEDIIFWLATGSTGIFLTKFGYYAPQAPCASPVRP